MSVEDIGQSGPLGRVGRLVAKVFKVVLRSTEEQTIIEPEQAIVHRRDSASRRPTGGEEPKENVLIVSAILGGKKHVTFGDAVRQAKETQEIKPRVRRIEHQVAPPAPKRVTPPAPSPEVEIVPEASMELMEMEE